MFPPMESKNGPKDEVRLYEEVLALCEGTLDNFFPAVSKGDILNDTLVMLKKFLRAVR